MDSYEVLHKEDAEAGGYSTEAVSPVVGVMLMLVVTIIIAAVVSASASGVSDETEKAPVSVIDAHVDMHFENMMGTSPNIRLTLLSGDSLQTNDLQIITYYTIPSLKRIPEDCRGQVIKHTIDGGLEPGSAPWDRELNPITHPQVNDGGILKLNEVGEYNGAAFGEFVWRPGRVLKVWPDAGAISDFFGFDIEDDDYGFGEGSFVEVNILHTPSGKIIFKKELEVKG
ncbi:FlaG/FlaF family flagellin (archaellin) [Methanofollis sp. W23]|uniref:type IV pilin N-terminal domain-containing protein n=1 Tax=Methanofollis sp. W23 TaxID=2817849 RepID=UPI001AE3A15E|nr:type IV pilin N-terminal domain-containing protein [Methanofollis sp. W23]MBP2145333.1 FlaG/FlaF family flagellin (archaellin) [Methanofollis sp. W23]